MVAATSIGVAYAVVAIVAIVAGVDVTATAVPGSKPIGARISWPLVSQISHQRALPSLVLDELLSDSCIVSRGRGVSLDILP